MDPISVLRSGPFREPAHVWLYEVGNATGFGCARHADALVVSVWPSRGIWLAGIEMKVSRGDWKKELDDPKKSAAIQKYCDYWWVAAPEGVVQLEELPETWGLYEIKGKKAKIKKQAPRLTPEAFDRSFVAAVLRNQSEKSHALVDQGRREGRAALEDALGVDTTKQLETEARTLRQERDDLKWRLSAAERQHAELKTVVETFERETGVTGLLNTRGPYAGMDLAASFKAAQILQNAALVGEMPEVLRRAAAALDEVPKIASSRMRG